MLPYFHMILVMLHVAGLVVAGVGIAIVDLALFYTRGHIDRGLFELGSNTVTWALIVLWITGVTLLLGNVHFDYQQFIDSPKLVAKVIVVLALTINGVALNMIAFPRMWRVYPDMNAALKDSTLPALLGAVSSSSWVYAGFIGKSKPIAALLGLDGYLIGYALLLVVASFIACVYIRPILAAQMFQSKEKDTEAMPSVAS